jgi:hypothetical protein
VRRDGRGPLLFAEHASRAFPAGRPERSSIATTNSFPIILRPVGLAHAAQPDGALANRVTSVSAFGFDPRAALPCEHFGSLRRAAKGVRGSSLGLKLHWRHRLAVVIEPVSADSLRVGDFQRFPPQVRRMRIRDESECAKSRDFRPISASPGETGRTPGCLAGDAVQIAPVSTQIPCKQGILQGILLFAALRLCFASRSPCAAGTFHSIPWRSKQGIIFGKREILRS